MTTLGLPINQWPEDWRQRWRAAVKPAEGVFDEGGSCSHWAPDTQNVIRKRLELFFGHLQRSGRLAPEKRFGWFLTEAILRPWIQELRERVSPVTAAGYVRDVRIGICAIEPEIDDTILKMVQGRLNRRARSARDKSAVELHPRDIYLAGLARMDRVEIASYEKEDVRGVQYGDGLALATVAASAIRLKNLVEIDIVRNFKRINGRYRLDFRADQMKGRRPFSVDLPAGLTPYIEKYLSRHRPKLLGGNSSDLLFISCYRRPMSRASMHARFKAMTMYELGVSIGPHRIRDIAVTRIATDHPEIIGIAPQLLHHTKLKTVQEHYNIADQVSAGKSYTSALAALRDEAIMAGRAGKLFGPGMSD